MAQVGTPSLLCQDKCGSDNFLIHSCRSSRGLPFSGSKDFRTGKEVAPWLLRVWGDRAACWWYVECRLGLLCRAGGLSVWSAPFRALGNPVSNVYWVYCSHLFFSFKFSYNQLLYSFFLGGELFFRVAYSYKCAGCSIITVAIVTAIREVETDDLFWVL